MKTKGMKKWEGKGKVKAKENKKWKGMRGQGDLEIIHSSQAYTSKLLIVRILTMLNEKLTHINVSCQTELTRHCNKTIAFNRLRPGHSSLNTRRGLFFY